MKPTNLGVKVELVKRKYHRKEVEEIINNVSAEHKNLLLENKQLIEELKEENEKLKVRLQELSEKESSITLALAMAEKQAEEIISTANLRYALEVERLKTFATKWNEYFNYVAEKYPYYPAITQAKEIYIKLKKVLNGKEDKIIESLEKELPNMQTQSKKGATFNPKQKIEEYVSATEDGFDLEKVLNPGELHLEDLCKELGLMEEE